MVTFTCNKISARRIALLLREKQIAKSKTKQTNTQKRNKTKSERWIPLLLTEDTKTL